MKKIIFLLTFLLVFFGLYATAQTADATTDTAVTFNIADSATFTGKYHYEGLPFEYMTISVQEGKLFYAGGEYSGFLHPIKEKKDTFDANGNATFTFLRNADNKVAQLRIDYQGQSYQGERDEKEKEN